MRGGVKAGDGKKTESVAEPAAVVDSRRIGRFDSVRVLPLFEEAYFRISAFRIVTGSTGTSPMPRRTVVLTAAILSTTASPSITRPKTA